MKQAKKDKAKSEIIRNRLTLWQLENHPPIVIKKEPRVIVLADNTPNPYGNIVPPNTPVTETRSVKK